MTVIRNEVRRGTYQDSVALMRIARALDQMPGVEVAGLMIGTPANIDILREGGVLGDEGKAAGPGDIVIAVRAKTAEAADAAMAEALQEFVKQQIAPYKYPRQVEFRTSLPRTETGKLQRFRLREEN